MIEDKQSPFEITPQVKRYVDGILFLHNEFKVAKLPLKDRICELRSYVDKDEPTINSEMNRKNFFIHLENQEAIKPTRKPGRNEWHITNDKGEQLKYPSFVRFQLLNIEPLKKIQRRIKKHSSSADSLEHWQNDYSDEVRFIQMGPNGDFYYGKQRKLVKFPNPRALYSKIFLAIFEMSNGGKLGEASYKQIDDFLYDNFRITKKYGEKGMKRVENAYNGSLRRHGYIPRMAPDGRPVLTPSRTRGVMFFYNPLLEL